jgi:CDP-glucose 4,6-dehydratase
MINRSFWKNKRVLVTGHTGFKGSWLSLWLNELQADVHGFALKPETNPSLFDLAKVGSKITSTFGDIRDITSLKAAVEKADPEIIIHMAAQPLVRKSYQDPVETYSINVMGTVNLLEAARSAKNLKTIINVTTDKVYDNKEWVWPYRENDRLGGFDPYSNSKACSELVTSSYRSSFFDNTGVKVVTARAGNVIGGGDWAEDRLIPDIIRAYQSKTKIKIRNPKAIRPWQHVLESLSGYLQLAEHLHDNNDYLKSWNFGPGTADFITVGQILNYVQKEMKEINLNVEFEEPKVHEAQILKLDNSQARENLNWKSVWNYSDAITKTFAWYIDMYSGKDASEITLKQIKEFEECL